MKILLISPFLTPLRKPEVYNLGLGYIAAALIQEGHDIKVLDIEGYRYTQAKVLDIIRNIECDIIGIGTIITGYTYVKLLIKEIKRLKPNIPIILGNSIGSTIPEIALIDLDVDFIVVGEGEITIKELIKAIEKKSDLNNIKGICFKKNGKIIHTAERELIEDIDSIPIPAWDLFPQNIYMNNYPSNNLLPPPIATISTVRGCPYHCTYCYHPFQNRKIRYHSPERIIKEIKILKEKYNINSFAFADDLSIGNKERIYKFCDILEEEKLNLKWQVTGRVNFVDENLLKRMKSAGCQIMSFGIESGSQKILNNIKKQVTVHQAKKAIFLCKKVGIYPLCSFMIGNVGETRETVYETVSFINKYLDEIKYFFITTPYPETELFEFAETRGLIKDKIALFENYGEQGKKLLVNVTNMSNRELILLKEEAEHAIRQNYFNIHPLKRVFYIRSMVQRVIIKFLIEKKKSNFKIIIKKIQIFIVKIIKKYLNLKFKDDK